MDAAQDMVQLNVRLQRSIKERGDETLALMGSSPAKIIRALWAKLAQGCDAYKHIERALTHDDDEIAPPAEEPSPLYRSTHLFQNMGESLGLDIASFTPYDGDLYELLEEDDWERLVERGLA